jgi:TonB family protein
MQPLSIPEKYICVIALCCLCPPGLISAQSAQGTSPVQEKAQKEYKELMQRVQQGDMSVDFRAFRIDGAIVAGSHISMIEAVDRNNFKKLMADSKPQEALKSVDHTLDLDYASTLAHFDAMTACRALNQPEEAAKHERLLNALLDSMAKTGDGKTPETSYLAATTQEEYLFMSQRLNLKPLGQQSLITKDSHFYDLLKVIDPKTNAAQDLWFNVDVQLNPGGQPVPTPANATKDPAAPVVVGTAQTNAPLLLASKSPSPQGSEGSNLPPPTDPNSTRLRQIAGEGAENCGEVSIPLRDADQGAIAAAENCARRCFAEKKPFHVRYTAMTQRNLAGLVIDGYSSIGLAMGTDGVIYESYLGAENGQKHASWVAPCSEPVQLERRTRGELICPPNHSLVQQSIRNGSTGNDAETAQKVTPAQPIPNGAGTQPGESKSESLKVDTTDGTPQTPETHLPLSQPLTIYDKDGVSVIATETKDSLELAVSEPDPIYVSVEIDRNGNGQFDRLVDVAYRPQANGNVCPQYLIDSQHNTPCGGFASSAYLRDFKDDYGRRQFVLVLPKKEISFDLPSARFDLVFRNTAQQNTTYFPVERFQKPIEVPYLIKQDGAPRVLPSASGLGFPSGDGGRQKDGVNADAGLYTVGGNVSAPVPLKQVDAEYSDQARRAKYRGVCLVGLVVDAQGNPQNVHVVRALGMGLDEKALEAVRQYKFKPAMKDGKTPVPVVVDVEVKFHLYIPASLCRTKAELGILPPGVFDALKKAAKAKDFEAVVRLANQPDSGLSVEWLDRNAQGKITSYGITDRSACLIADKGRPGD